MKRNRQLLVTIIISSSLLLFTIVAFTTPWFTLPLQEFTSNKNQSKYSIAPSYTPPIRILDSVSLKRMTTSSTMWDINKVTIIENRLLIINEDMVIHKGGALVLKNVTIWVNASWHGENNIFVEQGGNLTLIQSRITALDPSKRFYIDVEKGAKFYMDKSEISYAGYCGRRPNSDILFYFYPGLQVRASHVIIKNSRLINIYCGIYFSGSTNISFFNNFIMNSTLKMEFSKGNEIRNNFFLNCSPAIRFLVVNDTRVFNNTLIQHNSEWGVILEYTKNISISNNLINCNKTGIWIREGEFTRLENNTFLMCGLFLYGETVTIRTIRFKNNCINGKALLFLFNQTNKLFEMNDTVGEVIIAHSENITLRNLNVSYVCVGLEILSSRNITILDSHFSNCGTGIYARSLYFTIQKNTIIKCHLGIEITSPTRYESLERCSTKRRVVINNVFIENEIGIYVDYVIVNESNNPFGFHYTTVLVKDNVIVDSDLSGITLNFGDYVSIVNNTISRCTRGIEMIGGRKAEVLFNNIDECEYALFLDFYWDSLLANNSISNNYCGLFLILSEQNVIISNILEKNEIGLYLHLFERSYNFIGKNALIGNKIDIKLEYVKRPSTYRWSDVRRLLLLLGVTFLVMVSWNALRSEKVKKTLRDMLSSWILLYFLIEIIYYLHRFESTS